MIMLLKLRQIMTNQEWAQVGKELFPHQCCCQLCLTICWHSFKGGFDFVTMMIRRKKMKVLCIYGGGWSNVPGNIAQLTKTMIYHTPKLKSPNVLIREAVDKPKQFLQALASRIDRLVFSFYLNLTILSQRPSSTSGSCPWEEEDRLHWTPFPSQ